MKGINDEHIALLALHSVPGVGGYLLRQLINHCGSALEAFRMSESMLSTIPQIGPVTAKNIKATRPFLKAEETFEKAQREEVQIIFFNDEAFPKRLKQIGDYPCVIYLKGNVNLETEKTVGIVGTRRATTYGKNITSQFIHELKEYKPLIISGLAYGIDKKAHEQSLYEGISTLGVLGSGIDVIYPPAHKILASKMLEQGGILSESPMGGLPEGYRFPSRNRIIAALSDVLIVVETPEKGGALITAELANQYNKDVFAVPGDISRPISVGCHQLIRDNKAHIITSIEDLEYIVRWEKAGKTKNNKNSLPIQPLNAEEAPIFDLLSNQQQALSIDEIGNILTLTPGRLASALLQLEMKGLIQSLPGKKYNLI